MAVGFKVKRYWYPIGTGSFFYSFFSTVSYRLEEKKWGSVFPILMNELYQGEVLPDRLNALKNEVQDIKERLKRFEPSEIIWNLDDLNEKPPWGDDISTTITSLSNYFVTSQGEDLIEMLLIAIEKGLKLNMSLLIHSL